MTQGSTRRRFLEMTGAAAGMAGLTGAVGSGSGDAANSQPALASGRTALVVAHGNSLRALVKYLDQIDDADIAELNIPTGIPLVYELDAGFRPVTRGGRYLDPKAAEESAQAVRNQGR